jgi:hypothetical protein
MGDPGLRWFSPRFRKGQPRVSGDIRLIVHRSAKKAPPHAGDVRTWTAIDCLLTANRVQLTSDGHRAYLEAVEGAFVGDDALLVRHFIQTIQGMGSR